MYVIINSNTREKVYESHSYRDCEAILEDRLQGDYSNYSIETVTEDGQSPARVTKVTLFRRDAGEIRERIRFVQMFTDPEKARRRAQELFDSLKDTVTGHPTYQNTQRRVNGQDMSGAVDICVLTPKPECSRCAVAEFCGTLVPKERLCGCKYFTPEQLDTYKDGLSIE